MTALLLYTKGEQLLDADQYELLRDEMTKLGIEVGLKGATCTLSKTSEELKVCVRETSRKAHLRVLPFGLSCVQNPRG